MAFDKAFLITSKYRTAIKKSSLYALSVVFSRRILEENEHDYYSGKFFFLFFRQTTECMRSGHFLQNY